MAPLCLTVSSPSPGKEGEFDPFITWRILKLAKLSAGFGTFFKVNSILSQTPSLGRISLHRACRRARKESLREVVRGSSHVCSAEQWVGLATHRIGAICRSSGHSDIIVWQGMPQRKKSCGRLGRLCMRPRQVQRQIYPHRQEGEVSQPFSTSPCFHVGS